MTNNQEAQRAAFPEWFEKHVASFDQRHQLDVRENEHTYLAGWLAALQWQAEQQKWDLNALHEALRLMTDIAQRPTRGVGDMQYRASQAANILREFLRTPVAALPQAEQQGVPPGFVLVPVEPTHKMLHEAGEAYQRCRHGLMGHMAGERAYAAMLAARPQAPQAEQWMPIETVPRDWGVTMFDVWARGERVANCWWGIPTYGPKTAGIVHQDSYDSDGPVDAFVSEPSHWMPTPPPPQAQGAKA